MLGTVFDGDWRTYDFSHQRIARLIDGLRGDYIGGPDTIIRSPGNVQRPRLQPHAAGLIDRLWYGAASRGSVRWAAQAGLNLLTGNFVFGEGATGFAAAQLAYVREYLERVAPGRPGRVALGRVIVPFDGADASTPKRYQAYEASRHDVAPQLGWRPAVTETSAA